MYYCIAEVDTNSVKTTEKDKYKKMNIHRTASKYITLILVFDQFFTKYM